jgi:single-strand DNA-binding protein
MTLFIGIFRLGRDAELRHTQSGEAVCNLALAANYGKPGDDGKRPVQWVDASLFGKRAEALAPHMLKGTSLFCSIEDVHVETFEKKDGTTATSLRGRVNQIEFASPKSESPAPAPAPRQQQPQSQGGYRSSEPRRAPAPRQMNATGTGFDGMDDDIPF